MTDFLMKPKIDFAFKEIMTDEKARIGFLSTMLKLNPKDIKETTLLNANLRKTYEDDKLGILDVRVLINDDTKHFTPVFILRKITAIHYILIKWNSMS